MLKKFLYTERKQGDYILKRVNLGTRNFIFYAVYKKRRIDDNINNTRETQNLIKGGDNMMNAVAKAISEIIIEIIF